MEEFFEGESYLDVNAEWSRRYLESYYWAVTIMVGSPIKTTTGLEIFFSCVVLFA